MDFFNKNANYIIYEYGVENIEPRDYSTYSMKYDKPEELVFINWYSDIRTDGTVHKDIIINLESLQIEERINDSGCGCSYSNYYTMDKGTLSSDAEKVTFNVISTEENHSKELTSISIYKIN